MRADWGVLLKIALTESSVAMTEARRDQLAGALPGPRTQVTYGTHDVTLKFWVTADDANEAVEVAANLADGRLRELGLDPGSVIRTHAANGEGRTTLFRGVERRQAERGQWSLMVKVLANEGEHVVPDLLRAALAWLDDPDASVSLAGDGSKFLGDDGSGFNIRFWVEADDPGSALRGGRERIVEMLAAIGRPTWPIVRAHIVTPEERAAVVFAGAAVTPANQIATAGE